MPIFRTFFHGKFSGLEITCLKSFLDYGHRVVVFAYDETKIPALFERANAAEVLPRDKIFFYRTGPGQGSIAGFTNLFRYTVLERYGDWWTDTDVLCKRSEWPQQECVAAWEAGDKIGNAVLKLPPRIAAICRFECEALGTDFEWGEAGPKLVTRVLSDQGMLDDVLPASSFYPVPYERWSEFFNSDACAGAHELCADAFGVHLWHEMGRRAGLNKHLMPAGDSYFGRAVRKHRTRRHFERRAWSQFPWSFLNRVRVP